MKKGYLFLKFVLVFTLLIWVGLPVTVVSGQSNKRPAAPVKVEKIVQKTVRPFVTLIGTAEPFRISTVASEVEGLVTDFSAQLGKRIKKREILAEIERSPLFLDLKYAEASLAEASENYKNALSELQRTEELFKKKSISSRQNDIARYAANALKQKIRALEIKIEAIKYDIERCSIKAPLSGFVVKEHTQVGQWLRKGGDVVTIVDMDPILVTVPVPDRYIYFIEPGQSLDLAFEFLPGKKDREGKVRSIIRKGDEKARTFPVQITVTNKDFSILEGMSSVVQFPVGKSFQSLLVNKDAVVSSSEQHSIFIVKDGKAQMIPIIKGQAYGSHVVINGEVRAGDQVVVEGNERLQPGQEVRIIESH
jgi:RND family efflux transporter MFP subunit